MPQGPIDRNEAREFQTDPAVFEYHHCDGTSNTVTEFGGKYRVFETYHRDGNTRNPKDASGWRNPAPFLHYQVYGEQFQVGDQIHVFESGPPCETTTSTYRGATTRPDGFAGPVTPSDNSVRDLALTAALLKLQAKTVDLGQNFAERKQTADLVSDACRKIAAGVRLFRQRHSPRTWRKIQRDGAKRQHFNHFTPGQKWLELQYGWKPLMSDIVDAANRIKSGGAPYEKADRVSVFARKRRTESVRYWDLPVSGGCFQKVMQGPVSHQGVVSLSYYMDNSLLPMFNSLGLVNPAALLWEETPYSFVVDWFLPVGNWLNAMTADLGWNFAGGSSSYKGYCVHRALGSVRYAGPNPNGIASGRVQFYKIEHGFSRGVYSSSPVPMVHLKNPLSFLHVSEAIALLQKAFR